jgi:hypothetical protein
MNKNLPENFVSDPEKILRMARSQLRSPDSGPRLLPWKIQQREA